MANFWVRNLKTWFLNSWENFKRNFGAILFWMFSGLKRSFGGQRGHLITKSVFCQNIIQNNSRNMKIKFLNIQENKFGKNTQLNVKISTNIITLWSYGTLNNWNFYSIYWKKNPCRGMFYITSPVPTVHWMIMILLYYNLLHFNIDISNK